MIISLILAVAVTVLAVFFASYNPTFVEINLFGYPVQGTIGLLLVVALGLGVVVGVLLMLPAVISRSWAVMRHKRRIQDLERSAQVDYVEDIPEE